MSRSVALIPALVAALALLAVAPSTVAERPARTHVIVVLRATAGDQDTATDNLRRAHRLAVHRVYRHALRGFAADLPPEEVAALARDPRVAHVDPDLPVHAMGQVVPTGIRRIGADHNSTAAIGTQANAVNVDVAVVDTGVDSTHPDLNVVGGTDCTGTGSYADDNGHGTHVAGTIGALDNGSGVVGVAPGARIWAVKVLDSAGSGTWSEIICGLDWVTQHAGTIAVANMSLGGSGADGGPCGSTSLHQAICNSVAAGVTYAVAAGNSGADASTFVPASYPEVITVAALADSDGRPGGLGAATSYGCDDCFASFSNYGAAVDLVAPGVSIYSTYKGDAYATMSGTSMATPHVTGAAALYVAAHGRVGPAAVQSGLVSASAATQLAGDPSGLVDHVLNVGDGWNPPAGTVPSPTPTATPTTPPTATPTSAPTSTPTSAPSPTATSTPKPTATSTPKPTATATNTPSPTPKPTSTPAPAPTTAPTNGTRLAIVASSRSANSTSSLYAYDNNAATYWRTTTSNPASAYVIFDLGSAKSIGTIQWLFARTGYAAGLSIQVSNDKVSWTTLASPGDAPANTWQSLPAGVSARYVRFYFTNPTNTPALGFLAEVRLFS